MRRGKSVTSSLKNPRTGCNQKQIIILSDHTTLLNLIFLDDVGTLGDVDTIEELTDIFVADQGGLVNVCCGLCDDIDVVTREVDFILVILWLFKGNGFWDWDKTDTLFTEEVTDFELISFLGHGDWEVICDEL